MENTSHHTLVSRMTSLKATGFSMPMTNRMTMAKIKGMVLPPI